MTVEAALRDFLEALDTIASHESGVTDTMVREVLFETIVARLVRADGSYEIPIDFEMIDRAGETDPYMNRQVELAVRSFIKAVEGSPDWIACESHAARQALIARDDVVSAHGSAYWLYLSPWEDEVWK